MMYPGCEDACLALLAHAAECDEQIYRQIVKLHRFTEVRSHAGPAPGRPVQRRLHLAPVAVAANSPLPCFPHPGGMGPYQIEEVISSGNQAQLEAILERDPAIVGLTGPHGKTPLFLAVEVGTRRMVACSMPMPLASSLATPRVANPLNPSSPLLCRRPPCAHSNPR